MIDLNHEIDLSLQVKENILELNSTLTRSRGDWRIWVVIGAPKNPDTALCSPSVKTSIGSETRSCASVKRRYGGAAVWRCALMSRSINHRPVKRVLIFQTHSDAKKTATRNSNYKGNWIFMSVYIVYCKYCTQDIIKYELNSWKSCSSIFSININNLRHMSVKIQ